jgi:hypothetical protein
LLQSGERQMTEVACCGDSARITEQIASYLHPNPEQSDKQRGLIGVDEQACHTFRRAAHAIDTAVADVGARELCVRKIGAAQVAFAEYCAGEIGRIEVGFGEIAVLKDAVLQASHAQRDEVELALLKQGTVPLRLIADRAREPCGHDLYAFERAAGQVDVR